MDAAVQTPGLMTLAEFLAWEERQDARLRGRPCQVYGSDLKIRTARSIRYPDAFVACPAVPASATTRRVLASDVSGTFQCRPTVYNPALQHLMQGSTPWIWASGASRRS